MNNMPLKAPTVDSLIRQAAAYPQTDGKMKAKVISIFTKLCRIASQGEDEYRKIWIFADRGSINDFGEFEDYKDDGTINTKREFRDLWLYEYPDKKKWYSVIVTKYMNVIYLHLNSELVFSTEAGEIISPANNRMKSRLLTWLNAEVNGLIKEIRNNPAGYRKRIERTLSHQKRIGKIKRSDYWSIFPEERRRFEKSLKTSDIKIIARIAEQPERDDPSKSIKSLTAGDFFRYCAIGYDSNRYFKKEAKKLTPKEKYSRMADGRDCGLQNIDEDSPAAFKKWYLKESQCGGHPWEICRGGNSTHISLYVMNEGGGWALRLAGMSHARVIETVKMAVALHKNKVPFYLENAKAILRMITGKDYIGIVPEHITPRYCHSLFPHEEEIVDFMNLDEPKRSTIIKKASWYPEPTVNLL